MSDWWEGPFEVRVWQTCEDFWSGEATPATPPEGSLGYSPGLSWPLRVADRSEPGVRTSLKAEIARWRKSHADRARRNQAYLESVVEVWE